MKAGKSKMMGLNHLVSAEDLLPIVWELVRVLVWMGVVLLVCAFVFYFDSGSGFYYWFCILA